MKIKFGIGRSRSVLGRKQVFITPCIGIVMANSFPDDLSIRKSITINISWLLWGVYVYISRTVRLEEAQQ